MKKVEKNVLQHIVYIGVVFISIVVLYRSNRIIKDRMPQVIILPLFILEI